MLAGPWRAPSRFPCAARECTVWRTDMSYNGNSGGGSSMGNTTAGGAWRNDGGVPPHAFDPLTQPELFRGVLTRRVFAFLIPPVGPSISGILAFLFIPRFVSTPLGLGLLLFFLVWAGPGGLDPHSL